MINIEAAALAKLKTIGHEEGHSLRVIAAFGGCNGVGYGMVFDKERTGDTVEDHDGFKVFVDKDSVIFVEGLTIGYVADQDRFTIQGSATGQGTEQGSCGTGGCGCGQTE